MPAKYADLGKKANDLFGKGYEHGKYKLEVETAAGGMNINTKGHLAGDSVSSSHEVKFTDCPCKGQWKTTWSPGSDKFSAEYENGKLVKGAKFTGCFSVPLNASLGAIPEFNQLKTNWSNDKMNVNFNTNLNSFNLDAVVALKQATIGAKLGLDKGFALTSQEVALNVQRGTVDFTMKSALNNDLNCVFHNQVNATTQLAISNTYSSKGSSMGLAAKLAGACGSSNQFKIANNGRFAISHITNLKCGGELTVSGEFDATNLNSGSHKIGAGLKFKL